MEATMIVAGQPLTKPVPGAWMAKAGMGAVYVPFEKIIVHDEKSGKDVVTGHEPGAHTKRLLLEGWMYVQGPDAPAIAAIPVDEEKAAMQARIDQLMAEMAELRAKSATDFKQASTARGK